MPINRFSLDKLTEHQLYEIDQHQQVTSDLVIKHLNLPELLNNHGDVDLIGAKSLGLMIANDIDYCISTKDRVKEHWAKLTQELLLSPHIQQVSSTNSSLLKAWGSETYSITVQKVTDSHNEPWECHIYLQADTSDLLRHVNSIRQGMSGNKRMLVMKFKYWAEEANERIKLISDQRIQSDWIYSAVITHHVATLDELVKYITTHHVGGWYSAFSKAIS